MKFVTYHDRGMLMGGYVRRDVDVTGWTDEQIKAAVVMPLNPPDVRRLDMEAIRAELNNALVMAQLDVTRINYNSGQLLSLCGGVLLRHIDQLIRSN